jgi:hypothetical protein
MSSLNITHSDKHKNVIRRLGTKNEIHSQTDIHGHMNTHEKHDFINYSMVHGIKDLKKHIFVNTHTKNAHSGNELR